MEGTTSTEKKKDLPESAEKFVRQVRRKTQRKFTSEEKIRIVIESMHREISVAELCRREGISSAVFYGWLKCFMEAGKSRLKGDSLRDASKDEVVRLKRENEQLKSLLGEKEYALKLIKKSLAE